MIEVPPKDPPNGYWDGEEDDEPSGPTILPAVQPGNWFREGFAYWNHQGWHLDLLPFEIYLN